MAEAAFRITYERYSDVHDDTLQMLRGGLLVKVADASGLAFDAPATLELVLPDGAKITTPVKVLQVLAGHGIAVTIGKQLVDDLQKRIAEGREKPGAGAARHERIGAAASTPPATSSTPAAAPAPARTSTMTPQVETLSHAEKIQLALHGNRDQRNAILRDTNRALHPFVLKNPNLSADDVLQIAKNAQSTPEILKLIAERREWLQKPQIAVALARNPKSPQDVGVRALDYVPAETLRQLAKGGALPHVVTAARKKVVK